MFDNRPVIKCTDGTNVAKEIAGEIGITRLMDEDNSVSETLVERPASYGVYRYLICTCDKYCTIYAKNYSPRKPGYLYLPIQKLSDNLMLEIPRLARYYSQLDISDDAQFMDYHNLCMRTVERLFRVIDEDETPMVKRAS